MGHLPPKGIGIKQMRVGLIGLGRMGYALALNMLDYKISVVAFDRSPDKIDTLVTERGEGVYSVKELVSKLEGPRVVLLMVPAGEPVDAMIEELTPLLEKDDTIIDGGNSFYKDSQRRFEILKKKGIHYLDQGTSGGISGARNGACLMVGGEKKIFERYEKLFKAVATKDGYGYMGSSGAGHFVKMVHNGIEYCVLEAFGEGFETLSKEKFDLDYENISKVWSNGSVIRSWISELAQEAFEKDPQLSKWSGKIGGGETGTWSLQVAQDLGVDFKLLAYSLQKRKDSMKNPSFGTKVVAALRYGFGQHEDPK